MAILLAVHCHGHVFVHSILLTTLGHGSVDTVGFSSSLLQWLCWYWRFFMAILLPVYCKGRVDTVGFSQPFFSQFIAVVLLILLTFMAILLPAYCSGRVDTVCFSQAFSQLTAVVVLILWAFHSHSSSSLLLWSCWYCWLLWPFFS